MPKFQTCQKLICNSYHFWDFMLYVTSHDDLVFGSEKAVTIRFRYQT